LAQYHTLTKLISIFLLSALILQTGFKVFLYLNYEVNKEAITLKYCENKSKPKMKCHGKCHLMKKLNEAEKKEAPATSNQKENLEVQLFSGPGSKTSFISLIGEPHSYLQMNILKTISGSLAIFHPPCYKVA